MENKINSIVNEIYEILRTRDITFAEAQEILNKLRYKLHASAKIK